MSESTSEVLREIVNGIRKTVYLPLRKKNIRVNPD